MGLEVVISILTLIITVVTKSHDPLSRVLRLKGGLGHPGVLFLWLISLECRVSLRAPARVVSAGKRPAQECLGFALGVRDLGPRAASCRECLVGGEA